MHISSYICIHSFQIYNFKSFIIIKERLLNVENNQHLIGCIEFWFISDFQLRQAFQMVRAI